MTKAEMRRIHALQLQGLAYRRIAAELGLSVNTVKSYCQRHPVGTVLEKRAKSSPDNVCKHCGSELSMTPGKRRRLFCSDDCRMAWWKKNRRQMQRKTYHTKLCQCCGREFSVYGKPSQKFCSRHCFADHRRKVVGA